MMSTNTVVLAQGIFTNSQTVITEKSNDDIQTIREISFLQNRPWNLLKFWDS